MKFIHLADLHLGKRVHEFSMLAEQKHSLEQILEYVQQYQPDGILIAGDIYDRSIPGADAVRLLDSFLTRLHQAGATVFLIRGNHDSAERLQFAGAILEESGIYPAGGCEDRLSYVTLRDSYGEVVVWLLPFVKAAVGAVACGAGQEELDSDAQVIECILKQHFYPYLKNGTFSESARHILVAHQFVTYHGEAEQCDSEMHSIGGLEEVDAALFRDFDYVALGHLHGAQKLGRETVRYAGSPLKYSFSEANQKKSVTLVELREKGCTEITQLPLIPLHAMRKIKGPLAALIKEEIVCAESAEDYIHATLTDEEELYDPLGQLRAVYPNLMCLEFENSRTRAGQEKSGKFLCPKEVSLPSLFAEFYEQQNGVPMSEEEKALFLYFLEKGEEVF